MGDKYELTSETKEVAEYTLYRIRALKDFRDVKKGDLGGWVEGYENLSQEGGCWVYGDAKVSGNAEVYGDAKVSGNAEVYGDAEVHGESRVYGEALVCGNANVKGDDFVDGNEEEDYPQFVQKLLKSGEGISSRLTPRKCHLIHMAWGIAEEAAEVAGVLKKHCIYGKDLSFDKLVEELGDLEYFLEGLRSELSLSRDSVLEKNVEKLSTRYLTGEYSDKQAIDRVDEQGG